MLEGGNANGSEERAERGNVMRSHGELAQDKQEAGEDIETYLV